jgi:hypothetical protein
MHHLHGAAGWVHTETGVRKARVDALRNCHLFDAWAHGNFMEHQPVVVLGDSKERLVAREPFDQAYQALRQAMVDAERLVVAGYSFGDAPLNQAIADSLSTDTELVIIDPAADIQERAAERLGVENHRIRVISDGLPAGMGRI